MPRFDPKKGIIQNSGERSDGFFGPLSKQESQGDLKLSMTGSPETRPSSYWCCCKSIKGGMLPVKPIVMPCDGEYHKIVIQENGGNNEDGGRRCMGVLGAPSRPEAQQGSTVQNYPCSESSRTHSSFRCTSKSVKGGT